MGMVSIDSTPQMYRTSEIIVYLHKGKFIEQQLTDNIAFVSDVSTAISQTTQK